MYKSEFCLTSNYRINNYNFEGEYVEIKSNKFLLLFFSIMWLVLAIWFFLRYDHLSAMIMGIGFFILFIFCLYSALDRAPKIIIGIEGIVIKDKGKFQWEHINKTIIEFIPGDGDSTGNVNLQLEVKGKIISIGLDSLNKNWEEVAVLIELFKTRHLNKINPSGAKM